RGGARRAAGRAGALAGAQEAGPPGGGVAPRAARRGVAAAGGAGPARRPARGVAPGPPGRRAGGGGRAGVGGAPPYRRLRLAVVRKTALGRAPIKDQPAPTGEHGPHLLTPFRFGGEFVPGTGKNRPWSSPLSAMSLHEKWMQGTCHDEVRLVAP